MDESTKRALDAALASPEFMAQVRQAVLESPIVKSKDAEIAHLQGEVEQAEREAQSERDDARNAARLCGEVEAERNALRTRVEELTRERDEARANYQFMVNRAADEKLDGYRELGARAEAAEAETAALRARVEALEPQAGRECPICGQDEPHGHSVEETAALYLTPPIRCTNCHTHEIDPRDRTSGGYFGAGSWYCAFCVAHAVLHPGESRLNQGRCLPAPLVLPHAPYRDDKKKEAPTLRSAALRGGKGEP